MIKFIKLNTEQPKRERSTASTFKDERMTAYMSSDASLFDKN